MRKFLRRLCGDRKGVTAIEYGLIAALIAVVCIAGLAAVGTSINDKFNTISTSVTAAGG
jgi:pilus assembly protein Flp/PilA